MTAYCLWNVREVTDPDAMTDYVGRVTDTVTAFGGSYVVVGGPWEVVEGDWRPTHPVLIEFPTLDRANEWYASELYAPLRKQRLGASVADAVFFEGVVPTSAGWSRAASASLDAVGFDLYRDVHKGIRSGLFAAAASAGRVDPHDERELVDTLDGIEHLLRLLHDHSAHEDAHIDPLLRRHVPVLAARIEHDHAELDGLVAGIREQVVAVRGAASTRRRAAQHRLYLGFSEFTARYLQHQTTEEAEVMPALAVAAPIEELLEVNGAIVGSIGPAEMEAYLRLIVPATNPLDLAELYGGMRAGAPEEAFGALLGLARDELSTERFDRLDADLGAAAV